MTWGVNLGAYNISVAVAEAKAIKQAFSPGGAAFDAGVQLDAIEIGNEADLYGHNGLRSTPWTITEYIAQYVSFRFVSFCLVSFFYRLLCLL
jgi:hypothetical protein